MGSQALRDNPLYDGSPASKKKGGAHTADSSPSLTPGKVKIRTCLKHTPWLMVLAVAVLIAAQVTWFVYAERYVTATQHLLVQLKVLPPHDLSHGMFVCKAVLLGVTSFLGLVMLLLGVAVKKQRLAKRTAASRAEWPQGFKSHATVAVSIILCILLWLIAAGFILLLCCTFTATGIALAGDVAAKQALSMAANRPPVLANAAQGLQKSLQNAQAAFETAAKAAPPFIRKTPWYERLTSTTRPHLAAGAGGGAGGNSTVEQTACPATCLNLRLITSLLPSDDSASSGCVCIQQGIQEGQQLLNRMWRDGLVGMIALALLASMATWLLVYCLVTCMITRRDHIEAQYAKSQQQDGGGGGNNDKIYMWQRGAGGATSPHSASDTMSSFPTIEAGGGGSKRPPHVLAPDLTSSTLSPSPGKQSKRGGGIGAHHHQRHHQQPDQEGERRQGAGAMGDAQADDIERPAMALQPDQLPAQPSNTLHHLDDVRRPSTAATSTPTPLTTGLLGGGASGGAAGRQPSGTTPQADRRRW